MWGQLWGRWKGPQGNRTSIPLLWGQEQPVQQGYLVLCNSDLNSCQKYEWICVGKSSQGRALGYSMQGQFRSWLHPRPICSPCPHCPSSPNPRLAQPNGTCTTALSQRCFHDQQRCMRRIRCVSCTSISPAVLNRTRNPISSQSKRGQLNSGCK